MSRIQLLTEKLSNQIAAGEVIERPASAVKELVENAIDSGATQIDIYLEQGGIDLIRVADNGAGIHPQDLLLAVTSHATSKIKTLKDLSCINSLGFRGEALASIASVSQLRLASRIVDEQAGQQIDVLFGQIEPQKPVAHKQGTTVEVRHLFSQIPARRKFLRTAKTEYLHCEEVVKRLALSHFSIGFTLHHNDREILRLPCAADELAQEKRVAKFFGKRFLQHALAVNSEAQGLHLFGWLGLPEIARNQADSQLIYLNGRMVKDRLLTHAIRQAYGDLIYPGRYPMYLLYLTIAPESVDVNVHPTKHEVRFHEPRWIHDFIVSHLQKALHSGEEKYLVTQPEVRLTNKPSTVISPHKVQEQLAVYEKMCQVAIPEKSPSIGRPIGIAKQRYVLVETEKTLLIIDGVKVEQQQLRERLNQQYAEKNVDSAPLLFPTSLVLKQENYNAWQHFQSAFSELGFAITALTADSIVVRAVPKLLQHVNIVDQLTDILSSLVAYVHAQEKQDVLLKALSQSMIALPNNLVLDEWLSNLNLESLERTKVLQSIPL